MEKSYGTRRLFVLSKTSGDPLQQSGERTTDRYAITLLFSRVLRLPLDDCLANRYSRERVRNTDQASLEEVTIQERPRREHYCLHLRGTNHV